MPWSVKKPSAADIAPDWLLPYCKQFMQELIEQGYTRCLLRISWSGELGSVMLTKIRAAALGRMHPNKYDERKYCLDMPTIGSEGAWAAAIAAMESA